MLSAFFITALLTEGWLSDAFSFFEKPKPRTNFEVALDFFYSALREIKFQTYNLIFFEYLIAIKTLVLIAAIYGSYRLIKGRHRTPYASPRVITSANPETPVTTVLNLHNTLQCDSTSQRPAKDNNIAVLNRLPIAEIGEFNERTDAKIWTMKLERYVQAMNVDKRNWVDVAIAKINESCLKSLGKIERFLESENGFEEMKAALIERFEARPTKERKIEIKDLAHRKQHKGESISDFGEDLMRMAEKLFDQSDSKVNTHVKNLFAEGIENEMLKIIAMDKLGKENLKNNEDMSMQEFIKYMQTKETSRIKSKGKNETSTKEIQFTTTSGYSSGPEAFETRTTYSAPQQNYHEYNHRYGLRSNKYSHSPPPQRKYSYQQTSNQYSQQTQPHQSQMQNHNSTKSALDSRYTQQPVNQQPTTSNQPATSKQINAQVNAIMQEDNVQRIVGKALFNEKEMEYLCDTGADKSIMSTDVVKVIAPQIGLDEYRGQPIYSASGQMKLLGTITLKCQFAKDLILDKAQFIVTEDTIKNKCIVGRDIIQQIPKLKQSFKTMQSTVQEMKLEIESRKETPSKEHNIQEVRERLKVLLNRERRSRKSKKEKRST